MWSLQLHNSFKLVLFELAFEVENGIVIFVTDSFVDKCYGNCYVDITNHCNASI